MSTDQTHTTILGDLVAVGVPLRIAELRAAGGPTEQHIAWCREFAHRLASNGEALLFKITSKKHIEQRTDSASMANDLVLAVAILSFYPGGIEFEGARYYGRPDEEEAWRAREARS